MKKDIFLSKVEQICDLPAKRLIGSENLKTSNFIDSLATLGLIAMLDKDFGINMTVDEMLGVGTFNDLYDKVVIK